MKWEVGSSVFGMWHFSTVSDFNLQAGAVGLPSAGDEVAVFCFDCEQARTLAS